MRISLIVAATLPAVLLLASSASAQSAGAAATNAVQPPPAAPPPQLVYAPGYAPAPIMKRQSTALFVTGVVLIPVGTLTAAVGAVTLVMNAGSSLDAATVPYTLLGTGCAMLVGGIVMTVVGNHKVPVAPKAALGLSPRPPKAFLEPLLGPTSAGIHVQF